MEAEEHLKAFQKKLSLWKQQTENNNFPLLHECVCKIEDMSGIWAIHVSTELKQTIRRACKVSRRIFPKKRVISSIGETAIHVCCWGSRCQRWIHRWNNLNSAEPGPTTLLSTFWRKQMNKYPIIAKKALDFFNTICYNISLWAILFEDTGHKNKNKEKE